MFFRRVMNILNDKGLSIISPNYKYVLIEDDYVFVNIKDGKYKFDIENSITQRKIDKCISIGELNDNNIEDGDYLVLDNFYSGIVGILVKMEEKHIEFCYLVNREMLTKEIFTNYGMIDKNDKRFMLITIK